MYSDKLEAHPAQTQHYWLLCRAEGLVGVDWLDSSSTLPESAVHKPKWAHAFRQCYTLKLGTAKQMLGSRRRLFTGLTLMPCGLYIWLAARLSLYPPVWLITWRRVSTWNSEDTDKRPGQTKARRDKGGNAPRKVTPIIKGYHKQEKVTNNESVWFGCSHELSNGRGKKDKMMESKQNVPNCL